MQSIKIYYVCEAIKVPDLSGKDIQYFETIYICTDALQAQTLKAQLGGNTVIREETQQSVPGFFYEFA